MFRYPIRTLNRAGGFLLRGFCGLFSKSNFYRLFLLFLLQLPALLLIFFAFVSHCKPPVSGSPDRLDELEWVGSHVFAPLAPPSSGYVGRRLRSTELFLTDTFKKWPRRIYDVLSISLLPQTSASLLSGFFSPGIVAQPTSTISFFPIH